MKKKNSNYITNKLIFDMMSKRFDRLENKLDNHEKKFEMCNNRIDMLENFKDKVLFMWAVVTVAATIVYDFIKSKVFGG